jgi:hypothetical protein
MIRKNKESMRNRSMAKRKMRTQQVSPPSPPLFFQFFILVSQEQGVDASTLHASFLTFFLQNKWKKQDRGFNMDKPAGISASNL